MNSLAPDITPTSYPSKIEHSDEHAAHRYTSGLPEIVQESPAPPSPPPLARLRPLPPAPSETPEWSPFPPCRPNSGPNEESPPERREGLSPAFKSKLADILRCCGDGRVVMAVAVGAGGEVAVGGVRGRGWGGCSEGGREGVENISIERN